MHFKTMSCTLLYPSAPPPMIDGIGSMLQGSNGTIYYHKCQSVFNKIQFVDLDASNTRHTMIYTNGRLSRLYNLMFVHRALI
jgi:hypothetical protein